MPKPSGYLRNAFFFALVVAVLALLQWFPPLRWLRVYCVTHWGWNWTWPFTLYAGTLIGGFLIRVERESERNQKTIFFGLIFILALHTARLGFNYLHFPIPIGGVAFQFFVAFLEEFLFRRIGYEGPRKVEERWYRDANLKRLGPVSLIYTSVLYGLLAGSLPLLAGNAEFNVGRYIQGVEWSLFFGLVYLAARSIWVPGFLHFLSNLRSL